MKLLIDTEQGYSHYFKSENKDRTIMLRCTHRATGNQCPGRVAQKSEADFIYIKNQLCTAKPDIPLHKNIADEAKKTELDNVGASAKCITEKSCLRY